MKFVQKFRNRVENLGGFIGAMLNRRMLFRGELFDGIRNEEICDLLNLIISGFPLDPIYTYSALEDEVRQVEYIVGGSHIANQIYLLYNVFLDIYFDFLKNKFVCIDDGVVDSHHFRVGSFWDTFVFLEELKRVDGSYHHQAYKISQMLIEYELSIVRLDGLTDEEIVEFIKMRG